MIKNDQNTRQPFIVSSIEAQPNPSNGGGVPLLPDPAFLWQILVRNLALVISIIVILFTPAAYFIMKIPPTYAARASILLKPSQEIVRTSAPGERSGIVNADEVDTEIRLIGSALVAERAARRYAAQLSETSEKEMTEEDIKRLGKLIRGTVRVTRSGQTRIADVTAVNGDAEFAATAANLVADAYLNSQVEAKTSETDTSAAFINARLRELERNSIAAQSALDTYKSDRGLVDTQGSTSTEQEIGILNQQLASARADLAQQLGRFNAAKEQLENGNDGQDIGAALGSGTIGGLRQQQANASARLAVLSQRYGPLHPERRQVQAEVSDIQTRIQQEIQRILSSLNADVQSARSRVGSLERSRQDAEARLSTNSAAQAGLNSLSQRADAARSIYETFLRRSQETGALRDVATPDATIYARAEVSAAPIGPKYKFLLVGAAVLAMGMGFAGLLLAEYLRRGVQTKRDVERRLGLRYAGAVPTLKSTIGFWKARKQLPHEYVLANPQSVFAESLRSIRTFLTLSPGSKPRAIAVSSALPGEGKTTTTMCLALTTAAEGVKTILVDADLRRRGSSRLLKYFATSDIYGRMLGNAPLKDCVWIDPETGLHVLGTNASPEGPMNPFREDLIIDLFDELRQKYEVIIIDTAPMLGVADGRVIATLADRVLLVTRWKKTSMRAVEAVTSMLLNTNAKVTGLALTQVNIKKYASTGDGDVYAYNKQFKGYYTN